MNMIGHLPVSISVYLLAELMAVIVERMDHRLRNSKETAAQCPFLAPVGK